MNLNYYARQGYSRTIAANAGLTLIESNKVTQPCTDGRTMWVPVYNPDWVEDSPDELEWWGFLIHETYHNDKSKKHEKHFKILKEYIDSFKREKRKPRNEWKELTNVLEDLRIEKREYGTYVFQDRVMSTLRSNYMRRCKKDAGELSQAPLRALIYAIQWMGFARFNAGCLGEDVLAWEWGAEVREMYSRIEDLMPEVYALDKAEEVFLITEEILKRLLDTDDPEEATSEEQDAGGTPKESEGGEEMKGKSKPKYVVMDHNPSPDTKDLPGLEDIKWIYRDSEHHDAFPGGIPIVEIKSKKLARYDITSILAHAKTEGLAAQIKRYLMVRSAVRMNGGHKRGVIDSGSMWKGVVYNNTDTGRRVFKQREEELNLDTAVTLLVDTSGSMSSSSKISYANAAAVVLNDVFAKVGVKCRVAGFTDDTRETISYVHKEFDERVSREELANRLKSAEVHHMGGNADGESVLWEYNKLMQRSEPKKVLVVLSDGMPCDSKAIYNVTDHTKQVIRRIEQQGKVSIVGIGIVDSSVRHFYTRHHVVNDVTNIEGVLLNLLKKEVLHA